MGPLPGVASNSGGYVVEINPEPTPLTSEVDEHLGGPAGTLLPELAATAGIDIGGQA